MRGGLLVAGGEFGRGQAADALGPVERPASTASAAPMETTTTVSDTREPSLNAVSTI